MRRMCAFEQIPLMKPLDFQGAEKCSGQAKSTTTATATARRKWHFAIAFNLTLAFYVTLLESCALAGRTSWIPEKLLLNSKRLWLQQNTSRVYRITTHCVNEIQCKTHEILPKKKWTIVRLKTNLPIGIDVHSQAKIIDFFWNFSSAHNTHSYRKFIEYLEQLIPKQNGRSYDNLYTHLDHSITHISTLNALFVCFQRLNKHEQNGNYNGSRPPHIHNWCWQNISVEMNKWEWQRLHITIKQVYPYNGLCEHEQI